MGTYDQFCPVAQALELVGERWSLLVVRELLYGSRRFGDILRGVPRMPRSMLARRLRQLEDAGLVIKQRSSEGSAYDLTDAGEALQGVLEALGSWSREFAHRRLLDEEIDGGLLMWNVQRDIDETRAPRSLVVLRVELFDPRCGLERYWLKLADRTAELCLTNPGLEETLVLRTDARTLTEVWLGELDFRETIAEGRIAIDGPPELVEELPGWFRLNHFVQLERGPAAP